LTDNKNGLITIASSFPVKETIDRMASIIQSKGMTVFLRFDHEKNAKEAGLPLRPTELIFFGNPKAGTLLMEDKQISGIDLPFKAMAWEDESKKVWLTYTDPDWLAQRHLLSAKSGPIIASINEGMKNITAAATMP
jgi:uncharacterized protein (DUF302 family)